MPNDVPTGYYDGPTHADADAVIERVRHELTGHPEDEVFQALDSGLRGGGVEPRLDSIEVLAREVSWRPDQD